MINISKAPAFRVHWYASDWRTDVCYICDTKEQAVAWAREKYQGDEHHIINVDWLPYGSDPRITVSSKQKIIDVRRHHSPAACVARMTWGATHA